MMTLGTTEVRLHPALLIVLSYAWLTGHLAFMLLSFLSIFLHEIGHGIVSVICGQSPSTIEITPVGAVLHLDDLDDFTFPKRLAVILAGPAVSLLLWFVSSRYAHIGNAYRMLQMSNLSLLVMNLLPALPLDGGTLLLCLLDQVLPKPVAKRTICIISRVIGMVLILLNICTCWRMGGWNLSLAMAGCSIIYGAEISQQTSAMAELLYFVRRKANLERKGSLHTLLISAMETQTLRQLVRQLPKNRHAVYMCIEPGTMKRKGILTENEIIQEYLKNPGANFIDVLNEHER